jgi:hypothetical protein
MKAMLDSTVAATLLCVMTTTAYAQPDLAGLSPEAAGDALIKHADEYHAGWISSHSRAHMLLYDEKGKEASRPLEYYAIEQFQGADGGHSFVIYDKRGTGLLTYMSRANPDNQWIWVPGLRRKRRINAEGIKGSFVGSEFTFEDFRSQYPRKYRNRLVGESQLDDQKTWVLERIPEGRDSAYSRLKVHLDQAHFRVLSTEFYDGPGRALKSLRATDWQQHGGRFWRATKIRIDNHQTGRASTWVTDSLKLDAGLTTLDPLMKN